MDSLTLSLTIALIIVLFIYYIKRKNERFQDGTDFIKSSIDGNQYAVVEPYIIVGSGIKLSKLEAANRLAQMNTFVLTLLDHLKNKYINGSSAMATMDKTRHVNPILVIQNLLERYQGAEIISEHRPDNLDETSYALNKEYIRFCLRDPELYDSIHSIEILKFVCLHEITHLAVESFDHPEEFWETFKFLLENSKEFGLHIPEDYAADPKRYCGLKIAYNPFYDDALTGCVGCI